MTLLLICAGFVSVVLCFKATNNTQLSSSLFALSGSCSLLSLRLITCVPNTLNYTIPLVFGVVTLAVSLTVRITEGPAPQTVNR